MRPSFETIQAAFGRMTPREKRLFGVLAGALVAVLGVAAWLAADAVVGSIEEEIEHGRETLGEIRKLTPGYLDAVKERKDVEDAVRRSQATSVRVAANDILKEIELVDDVPGAIGSQMSDVVSFEGKVSETPVDFKKRKKKKGKRDKDKSKGAVSSGIVRVEQKLDFREVPWVNLSEFLDRVEQGDELLFVTRLDIARKFNELSRVRATVTIESYRFRDEKGKGHMPGSN